MRPTLTATPGVRNKEKQGGGSRSEQIKVGVGRSVGRVTLRFQVQEVEQGTRRAPYPKRISPLLSNK